MFCFFCDDFEYPSKYFFYFPVHRKKRIKKCKIYIYVTFHPNFHSFCEANIIADLSSKSLQYGFQCCHWVFQKSLLKTRKTQKKYYFVTFLSFASRRWLFSRICFISWGKSWIKSFTGFFLIVCYIDDNETKKHFIIKKLWVAKNIQIKPWWQNVDQF